MRMPAVWHFLTASATSGLGDLHCDHARIGQVRLDVFHAEIFSSSGTTIGSRKDPQTLASIAIINFHNIVNPILGERNNLLANLDRCTGQGFPRIPPFVWATRANRPSSTRSISTTIILFCAGIEKGNSAILESGDISSLLKPALLASTIKAASVGSPNTFQRCPSPLVVSGGKSLDVLHLACMEMDALGLGPFLHQLVLFSVILPVG